MNLADSIFIFGLALIIFGPKKLPEIGRQIGKIMLEFRRASNEFKMQIEEELRSVEQADRQKQLAASEVPASDTKNSAQAIDESATSSSEALTVRPPSTGATESTESPYKPFSAPEEIPESTASEAAAGDLEPVAGDLEPVAGDLEPAAGDLTIAETEPDRPESAPYAPGEHQIAEHQVAEHQVGEHQVGESQVGESQVGESQGLQEQATTHHG